LAAAGSARPVAVICCVLERNVKVGYLKHLLRFSVFIDAARKLW
jgi:hypothetical protein